MTVATRPDRAGPILHFREGGPGGVRLAALVVRSASETCTPLRAAGAEIVPARLAELEGLTAWRYDFQLGPEDAGYELDGVFHPVVTDLSSDLRVAFVSCNGEEEGDLAREPSERNAMWARLAASHEASPFALLIQGGDQIYADEATKGHPLGDGWPDRAPSDPSEAQLADFAAHLRRKFLERYMTALAAEGCARVVASIPTLAVWDDHDICDGWGSLPERRTDSAVGRTLFRVARELYLLFQHGATEADVPDLFLDPAGSSLSWRRSLPGLTLFAPDLRSERRRRQVMAEPGWRAVTSTEPAPGHTFLISSVPLLGPRLSLVERFMLAIPRMQKYEDDLRDQWQSRAHRPEWKRMLHEALRLRRVGPLTVLSGEIHLAGRAEMGEGASLIHQLVASGISHRPPPGLYARALSWLGGLGEAPLRDHPIRILPLPGQRLRYIAQRNYLTLDRRGGDWTATWDLEEDGPTPPLPLQDPS